MTESELLTISKTERYSYLTAIILAIIAFMITLNNTAETVSVQSENIVLPVIMYHGFTSESDESEYVLNIVDFEKDIRYLNEEGFAFVTAREVAEFTSGNGTLPSKPVMLTFDDGYLNNYTEAFPILKKYNAKAVISPVMYFSEADNCNNKRNPAYSNLNFDEIKKMSDSGLIEFQNHSYNLHSINHTRHGSGKSKKGSLLAQRLGREFVDVDEYFGHVHGMSPAEAIVRLGEGEMRRMETEVLSELGRKSGLVIATGGGCVTREDNYLHLHRNGLIIWVKRPLAELPTNGRPLSQSCGVSELYARRAVMYERFADVSIEVCDSVESAVEAIMEAIK